ncbi:MAG: hypothetical protein V1764_04555 [Nitrospirota bacterium]
MHQAVNSVNSDIFTGREGEDEIIIETPVANAGTAAGILKDSMIEAGKIYLKDVPVIS